MIDEYAKMCSVLFETVGRQFTAEELTHLRAVLQEQLAEAYSISPRSTITISYNAPQGPTLNYHIQSQMVDADGRLREMDQHREPPLFGTNPTLGCGRWPTKPTTPSTSDTRNRGGKPGATPCSGTTWASGRRRGDYPEVRRHDQLR